LPNVDHDDDRSQMMWLTYYKSHVEQTYQTNLWSEWVILWTNSKLLSP